MVTAVEHALRWYELYQLHGTCPRCGKFGLLLEDNIWIPPHEPSKALCDWRSIDSLAGTYHLDHTLQCGQTSYLQAVEDGGVLVELKKLELVAKAVREQNNDNPCTHSDWDEEYYCQECNRRRNFNKAHTDCWHSLVKHWSRENKNPEAARRDVTPGVLTWRDRKPIVPKTVSLSCRQQWIDEIKCNQASSVPHDKTLRRLDKILQSGLVEPKEQGELVNYSKLRQKGFIRKVEDCKKCRVYQVTPLGAFMIGKYFKGWNYVLGRISKFRLTHVGFDPAMSTSLAR